LPKKLLYLLVELRRGGRINAPVYAQQIDPVELTM
jgi:hypothetical protein